eukprot:TRINITY_DN2149_c0_g1_i1.p1 TRINITY_DN2149_c0_g1~~TRINITY_DN2149_c0_g1_i1.p1  ORF type:complete len:431 (-),score=112.95 TRINITY_DN2149_c0_g1_i1:250-1482(-)
MDFLPMPSEIAGVKIPPISIGDLTDVNKLQGLATDVAINAGAHAAGLDGALDSAKQVHEVLKKGLEAVGSSCKIMSAGAESIGNIQKDMQPVMPLLLAKQDPVSAWQNFSKDNFSKCVKVIEHVLSLSNVMDTIGKVLQQVWQAFAALEKSAKPLVDKVKEALAEAADLLAKSLNIDRALGANAADTFTKNTAEISKGLAEMKGKLQPILDAWNGSSWATVAAFGYQRWQDIVKCMQGFWPLWEKSQSFFNTGRGLGVSALGHSKAAWGEFSSFVEKICGFMQISVPDWLSKDANPLADIQEPPEVTVAKKPQAAGLVQKLMSLGIPIYRPDGIRRSALCRTLLSGVGGGVRPPAVEDASSKPEGTTGQDEPPAVENASPKPGGTTRQEKAAAVQDASRKPEGTTGQDEA